MFSNYFIRYFALLTITTFIQTSSLSIFSADAYAQKNKGTFEPDPNNPIPKTTVGGGKRGFFEPPAGEPAPTISIGGGRRSSDGQCPKDRDIQPSDPIASNSLEQLLVPLLPTSKLGFTFLPNPTFFVYVPKTSAIAVEFTLENQEGKGIYQNRVNLTNSPSIISFQLDPKQVSLEVGKDYKWLVSVVCETGDPEDTFSEGIIRRIKPNPDLIKKLEKASAIERVDIYAKSGIWHEAMANLAQLRLAQPNSPELKSTWLNLLKSSSLESLANTPLKN